MSQHPSYHGRPSRATPTATAGPVTSEPPAADATIRYANRACCCVAQPAVIVVVPPRGERLTATDLLLCGHHYRVSKAALAAAGATILDVSGDPLEGDGWPGGAC